MRSHGLESLADLPAPHTVRDMAAIALALKTIFGFFPDLAAAVDPLLVVTVVASLPGDSGRAMTAGVFTGAIEDAWSTIVLDPGATAWPDASGHLIIAVEGDEP